MMRCSTLLIATYLAVASVANATTIDSINGSAGFPAGSSVRNQIGGGTIGWYYTPTFGYNLDGVFTTFEAMNTTQLAVTPIITVQIWTDRPINGGVLLGQGSFQGNSFTGGTGGASFSPVALVAGHAYFVDFVNIFNMGINFGTWDFVSGVPTPSNGATTSYPAFYTNTLSDGFGSERTDVFLSATGGAHVNPAEPILFFSGFPLDQSNPVVPEPSSIALIGLGSFVCRGILGRKRK